MAAAHRSTCEVLCGAQEQLRLAIQRSIAMAAKNTSLEGRGQELEVRCVNLPSHCLQQLRYSTSCQPASMVSQVCAASDLSK